MSKAVTALAGAATDGPVSVKELPLQGMITLRGDLNSAALKKAVKAAVDAKVPSLRMVEGDLSGGAVWMSPDELLILCAYDAAPEIAEQLAAALTTEHALVVNVSDARAAFELSGEGVRDVLAKLAPVDLSPVALPANTVRRTRLAQSAAAFWLTDENSANIICFRSVAGYVFDLLSQSADSRSRVGFFE